MSVYIIAYLLIASMIPFQKHDIPLSAIPCLQYMKALEIENNTEENKENNDQEKDEQEGKENVRKTTLVNQHLGRYH